MRSHVTIQSAKPKTRIITRLTVTEITEPLSTPLPPLPEHPINPINLTSHHNPLPQPLIPSKDQSCITQNQNSLYQTGDQRNYHREPTNANNRSNNVSASGSIRKRRNKVFERSKQRDQIFVQSRFVQGSQQTPNQSHAYSHSHSHSQSLSQFQSPSQPISQSQSRFQINNKPLQSTRVRNYQQSRRSETQVNQNLKIIPIEVYSYPNSLPEVCCKVKHTRS